ncbi:hypothetical protein, partial [Streptomyces sp. NPDC020362]|uniref:hypothetical protein n=1 Tax=Streptomyces sp. NPDC020362 TaxID=3154486 RepID=UPI0033F478E9
MSDAYSRAPEAEPDFLDRLIARHAAASRPGTVRVRPRLPGPFERVEAVRARTADPDATDTVLWPSAAPAPVPERDAPRPAAEVRRHTERERTVVRTRRDPAEPPARPAPPALPDAPLLRPAAPLAPGPRPVPLTGPRTSGRGGPESGADRDAAPVPIPPGTGAAPPSGRAACPSSTQVSSAQSGSSWL